MKNKNTFMGAIALITYCAASFASAATGRTQGNFDVSSTGAAIYSIPIYAPPGPNGLQPAVALTYNSNSGKGTLGIGWGLSGISAITRCGKTYAQDGVPSSPSLSTSDALCMDGRRLRLTSGTQGEAGSTYQTEIADFSLVTAVGMQGSGPAYFTVRAKSGLIYEYGNTTDARVSATGTSTASLWMLNKVSDRAGNRIVYTYKLADAGTTGTTHPVKIEWTATSAGAGTFLYSMDFAYGNNVPATTESAYIAGTLVTDDDLLTSISIAQSGTVKKKYFLAYESSPTTAALRLQAVTECSDAGGTDCLSPTQIGYQNGQPGVATTPIPVLADATRLYTQFDLNGDGFKDLVYLTAGIWYAKFSSTGGFGASVTIGSEANLGLLLLGDVRGEGRDGILAMKSGGGTYYLWNGSGFGSYATGLPADNTFYPGLVDVTGDGLPDLVSLDGATSTISYRPNISTSSSVGFGSPIIAVSPGETASGFHVYDNAARLTGRQLDFNGDSRADFQLNTTSTFTWIEPMYGQEITGYIYTSYLIVSAPNGGYTAEYINQQIDHNLNGNGGNFSPPTFMDINDDGCTDYTFGEAVIISGCGGATAGSTWLPSLARAIIDWNGDGRSDVMAPNNGVMYIHLSTATGLLPGVPTGLPADGIWGAADLNGDGLEDLIRRTGANSPMAVNYFLHNGSGVQPDLATSFTDGYGVNQTVSYVPATWNNYTKQSNSTYPNRDYAGPMQIVSNVNSTNGVGGTFNRSYWYYGAAHNIQGRGFAGFASRKVTDSRTGAYTVDSFERAFPYTGSLIQTIDYQPGGTPIRSHVMTPGLTTLDPTANNQRYFAYPASRVENQYEVGGSINGLPIRQTSESRTYDNYGNTTAVSTTVTDTDSGSAPNSWTTAVSASYSSDPATWCLGLPISITTAYSTTSGEAGVTRHQTFSNDNGNCRVLTAQIEPQKVSVQSGGVRRVNVGYGYDGFGNVNSVSVTGLNSAGGAMSARTTTIGWGATGQFPVSETNPLSQTTTRTFHSTFGELATETDPNGIVVVNDSYDSFGRLSRKTRADGTFTDYYYDYLTPGNNPLGIDYVRMMSYASDSSFIRYDYIVRDRFGRMVNEYHADFNSAPGGGYWAEARGYDALGRVAFEGIPFWAANGYQYTPAHAVTYAYDLLGRVTSQTRPQSQSLSTPVTTTFTYAGRTQKVTDPQGQLTTKILDVNGWMRRSQDHHGNYQIFGYDAAGSLKLVTDNLGNTLFTANYSYGIRAFQDSSNDMDLGVRNYSYNSLGELTGWTDAKGQSFSQEFDALSRVISRTEPEGTTYFNFDSGGSYAMGRLSSTSKSGYGESFAYDNKGRLSTHTISTDQSYAIDYAYNTFGQLDTLTYPVSTSGARVKVKYGYSSGILQSVTDWTSGSAGAVYWTANARNARAQVTQETLGNGVVTNRAIDAVTGWTSSIQSGAGGGAGLQNQSYLYDLVGNVTQRQENNLGLTENFYYDYLYRLDYSQLNGTTNLDMNYDGMGNITSRSDIASGAAWVYHPTKKHAVIQAGSPSYTYTYDANGNATSRFGYGINWTSSNYPSQINGPGKTLSFYYDSSYSRYKQVYTSSSGTETTYYVGGLLEKVSTSAGTDWRHYVKVGSQTVAIVSRLSTGVNTTRYMLEDHQGSPASILLADGSTFVKESFTAFGARRDAATWSDSCQCDDLYKIKSVSRMGYTGHEAIGGVSMGLNHMNGRVQDAIVGRFLSPDPYIAQPGWTQAYNRYSYAGNNPLSYVDPSGFIQVCNTYMEWNPTLATVGGWETVSGTYVRREFCFDIDNIYDPNQWPNQPPSEGGGGGGGGAGGDPAPEPQKPQRALESKRQVLSTCLREGAGAGSSQLDANDLLVTTGSLGVDAAELGVGSVAAASTKGEFQQIGSLFGGRELSLVGQQQSGRAMSEFARSMAPVAKGAGFLGLVGSSLYDFGSNWKAEGGFAVLFTGGDALVTAALSSFGAGLPLAAAYSYGGGSRGAWKAFSRLASAETCNALYSAPALVIP